ncbi:conserved hypothetical protein [Altererythrobacter sp. B11]|uniref:TolC family protein n=1 Tax=Altererythrobacter sp. B11 TaxID=2060312 RepID=UPI000DC72FBC|nr:TolC family protein [Altererythrobacter sp. B11]BBC70975.1 conserved hypothetical protein [Altererythrobacter sp. B11]
MRKTRLRRELIGAIIAPALLIPVAAHAETLGEAIVEAYQFNPNVQASRARNRAADERVARAEGEFGPFISGSASYDYNYRRLRTNGELAPAEHGFTPTFGVTLSQPLFTSGRLSSQLRIAEANYGASTADMRAAELNLLANVIIAYASVLRDQNLVSIARENLDLLGDQLGQTQARFDARYATRTDLDQTRNRLLTGQAQLELAEGNLRASRNAFRNLVGHYPDDLAPLPQLPGLPQSLEEAEDMGLRFNPVLEAARFDSRAARAAVGLARSDAGPQVTLQGTAARTPLSIENDAVRQFDAQARIEVTMPLYAAGRIAAGIREAKQSADAANQVEEQVTRDVREDIASAWDRLSANRRASPAYAEAVTAAETALQGAREQQLAGQLTALNVLDTARDLLNSRQAKASVDAQLYIQHAILLAAMGQLSPGRFGPMTPEYDPDSYSRTAFAGLPTGPLVELLDDAVVMDGVTYTPVQQERSEEPGHDMAPAAETSPAP